MDFEQLHKNVKHVADNFDEIIIGVASQHEEEVIDLNTSQLEVGKLNDGSNIEPEYMLDDYADFKKAIGSKAPKGTPDLKLEGDFYSGFNITYEPKALVIDSSDEKAAGLESKYSSDIYGLTDKNINELQLIIQPTLVKTLDHEFTR
ncbi:hypothetical protein KAR91_36850 [Candidatus Pacearchaeota archaeon]|nr:hypothetical protein [Candidatus Pacearchaeota archaeon]